jgi:hypothetical protein
MWYLMPSTDVRYIWHLNHASWRRSCQMLTSDMIDINCNLYCLFIIFIITRNRATSWRGVGCEPTIPCSVKLPLAFDVVTLQLHFRFMTAEKLTVCPFMPAARPAVRFCHCVLYVRVPTPVPVWYCTWVTLELHVRGTLGEVRQVPYYLTGNYSHNSHILRLLCIIVVPFIHLHHYLWFLAFVVVVFQNHCFQKSIHVLILLSRLFRLE